MPSQQEGVRLNPRPMGKEILTDRMIVEEVRKGDNYVIWKSPKTTVHIIPDGKLKELIKKEVQQATTSLTEAHKVEMEKLVEEILNEQWKDLEGDGQGGVSDDGELVVSVQDIHKVAKKFNTEVK